LTGSAHAPPIKGVRADCDSQHDKKIKRNYNQKKGYSVTGSVTLV
jgi:hypothetical protein